jgi:hypothetical protein
MRKSLYKHRVIIAFILIFFNINLFGQVINATECGCDHIIAPADLYVDGGLIGAGPGDVVCIAASNKQYLGLKNFHGTTAQPIIFKNCGGQVVVGNTDWYYAIRLDKCTNFRFTGTGSGAYEYGFRVSQTPVQIPAVSVGDMSNHFELDHIEISSSGFAGILAKTDPDCSGAPNRGNFVMSNISIHDNLVRNTNGEGIYVGFPHFRGVPKACNGDTIMVIPHEITGLKIFNNTIDNTQREGLQVGCAVSDVEIYQNYISNFGLANIKWQRSGVHLSTGTSGKFFSNAIVTGTGAGMWLNGHGNNQIFNNLIVDSGEDGIMVYDSIVVDGTPYNIINNTIVNCAGYGMRVYTERNTLINFSNNIVTGWGSGYTSIPGSAAITQDNNVAEPNPASIKFEDLAMGNFRLTAISPAVDAGVDMSSMGVTKDYEYVARFRGKAFDAGAFESPYERLMVGYFVYPNPVYLSKINLPPSPNQAMVSIQFVLADDSPQGSLRVVDTHGRVVAIIAEGPFEKGKEYNYTYNGFFLNPGMYFYILEANDDVQVKKIIHIE